MREEDPPVRVGGPGAPGVGDALERRVVGEAQSAGVPGETAQALYDAADAALYAAKEGGRNQTRCAPADGGGGRSESLRLIRA